MTVAATGDGAVTYTQTSKIHRVARHDPPLSGLHNEEAILKIKRVVPNIRSDELSENRGFYVDTLGFDVAMDMGWIVTFVSPSNPTAQIQVLSNDESAPTVPDISIEVEDVDSVHAAIVEGGYPVVYPLTDESWGVRRFFARDPNGLVVNILSHRSEVT